jgi:hypothetical protein
MPKFKKPLDAKDALNRLDRIWNDVDLTAWAAWLAEVKPDARFFTSGPHVKGRCPFHGDTDPSFVVTPGKAIARCFGCHRAFWNPIHLVAELNGTSWAEALLFMKKRWGLSAAIPKALYETFKEREEYAKLKEKLMRYFAELLHECLSSYARKSLDADGKNWSRPTVEYLLDRRLGENGLSELVAPGQESNGEFDQYGVLMTMINTHALIGILPSLGDVRAKFGDGSEEAKFFESYFADYINGAQYIGYLVFPYDDSPTTLCRFKMREPMKPCKKQVWVKDKYEDENNAFHGFYGLRYYRTYLTLQEHGDNGPEKGFPAYLTEGEFDALSAIAQQIRRSNDDYMALGMSGGGAQGLDWFAKLNVLRIRFLQDRDHGGNKFIKQVLEKTHKKVFGVRVFNWPDEYVDWKDPKRPDARIKDVDDAIREVGYKRWVRYVTNDDMYDAVEKWTYDRASDAIEQLHVRDVASINRTAKEFGALLRDEQVCRAFCTMVADGFGLDGAILHRDIFVKEDNEVEFTKRIHAAVLEHWHPIGIQNAEGRKRLLLMWHKTSKTTSSVVLGDERAAETFVAPHFGPIYDFIAATVSDAMFLVGDDTDLEPAFNVTSRAKRYCEYLKNALLIAAKGLPSMDHAPTRAQGVHMARHAGDQMLSYMINGRDVYVLKHDGPAFTATALDGPSHEGFVFQNTGKTWIESVTKAEDLLADVDLVALFHRVRDMIDSGWTFRYQQLDCMFLAAYVMSLAVMTVFTRQTAVILNAEHQAGKSRFTSGFVGGTGFGRINVVAHALAMQGYTAASIRQQHSDTSLCLCLEEFEDYGGNDAKSIAVRKVLELTRDLISENAVNWSIGTATGESRTYRLRFPLMTCAIRPLRDAASLSRFIRFELVKDDARIDPVDALVGKFGEDLIKKTRHDMFVGVLRHMLTLRKTQSEVGTEYSSNTILPAHASSRFREALVPILSILRFIGELAVASGRPELAPDYKKFAYDFAETRREQLAQLKSTAQDEQVFEAVISSTFQVANVGDKNTLTGTKSLRQMFLDLNQLEDINKTMQGVYIDTKMEWLVVSWYEAQNGVLSQSMFRNTPPTWLRDVAQRSPFHVPAEEVKNARVLERLMNVMGPAQNPDMISVFSVKHMLDIVRAHRDAAMKKSETPVDEAKEIDPNKVQGDEDIIV